MSLSLLLAAPAQRAQAACNLIPQTTQTFSAALGTTNRPFAAPGEFVEIGLRPCDVSSPGFTSSVGDQVVTVIFTPPGSAPRNAVVLTTAACSTLANPLAACQAQLAGGQASCVDPTMDPLLLSLVDRNGARQLSFHFPDTSALLPAGNQQPGRTLSGSATIAVTRAGDPLPCALAKKPCTTQSGLLACIDQFFTDDGNCGRLPTGSSFGHFTALPVPNSFQADCFDTEPPCTPAMASELRLAVDEGGNLLIPMDWSGIRVPGNVPVPRLLHGTVVPPVPVHLPGGSFLASFTSEGALLPPIFEPQLGPSSVLSLFGSADAPYTILRIARRSTGFTQCAGGPNDGFPCNVPDDCPGLCSGGTSAGNRCVDSAECPGGTCGGNGTCVMATCVGGTRAGNPCTGDGDCPGGQCGPALFDFGGFAVGGVGPVALPRFGAGVCQSVPTQTCSSDANCPVNDRCVLYALEAQTPVPLEGLIQTPDTFAFVVDEAVAGQDLNCDTDATDTVVTLRDRQTGNLQPLGAPPGCGVTPTAACAIGGVPKGRAIVRIAQPPFSFPAVSAEGNTVAVLESELGESRCDENGNGRVFDSILRVFQLGQPELTAGTNRAVDAALLVNDRSLAVSHGQVFFRTPEAAAAPEVTVRAGTHTMTFNDEPPSTSADGRYVAFGTKDDLLPADTNGTWDVYIRDLVTGTLELVSATPGGTAGNSFSRFPYISPDGRWVTFITNASDIAPGATQQALVLRDRCVSNGVQVCTTPSTEQVGLTDAGGQPAGGSGPGRASVSADGRFVAWGTDDTNLVPNDTNSCGFGGPGTCPDIFVRDRCISNGIAVPGCVATTERVSVATDGTQGNERADDFNAPGISDDGNIVAFMSLAGNIVSGQLTGVGHIYARNRELGTTELVSARPDGSASGEVAGRVAMSGDGRYVAFESEDFLLVPGIPFGFLQYIFVHDRLTGTNELVSHGLDGTAADDHSYAPSISRDGRYVAYVSCATNLVPGDTNICSAGTYISTACTNRTSPGSCPDVFVNDRVTGSTRRVNVAPDGSETSGDMVCDGFGVCQGTLTPCMSNADCTPLLCAKFFCGLDGLSGDGGTVAFTSNATTLIANDTNGLGDTFVRRIDPASTASHDLTGDGDLDDTVLQTLDTTSGVVTALCPGDMTSAAAGAAAFLRPEAAGPTTTVKLPLCPTAGTVIGSGIDLNNDGDAVDEVVHFVSPPGGPPPRIQNLGRAAVSVSLSASCVGGPSAAQGCDLDTDCPGGRCVPSWLAALVTKPGGSGPSPVVEVHPAGGTGGWTAPLASGTGVVQAADVAQVAEALVAFIPHADRVLQFYDANTGTAKAISVGQEAEEFVLGSPHVVDCGPNTSPPWGSGPHLLQLVTFRTREATQCAVPMDAAHCRATSLPPGCTLAQCDLNHDGDCCDDVLQVVVYDVNTRTATLLPTPPQFPQAVRRCGLEACDPRLPYRVFDRTVKFLTFECDQGGPVHDAGCPGGTDLNGNGTADDLVVRFFDLCTGVLTTVGTVDPSSGAAGDPLADPQTGSQVSVASAGRCVANAPGSCLSTADCSPGATCQPDLGRCVVNAPGSCLSTADCSPGATCQPDLVVEATPTADTNGNGVLDALECRGQCQASCTCATTAGCTCAPPNLCAGVMCGPLDQCHVAGTCDPTTGNCSNPAKSDGSPCDDGVACTRLDTCTGGVCIGHDITPPVVTCSVAPLQPFPPNHNLVNVGLSATATDACDGPRPVTVAVFGNEDDQTPTDSTGTVFSPDAANIAPGTLRLRDERVDTGGGRVYLIVPKATDRSGNTGFACCTVGVPHDQSARSVNSIRLQAAAANTFCSSHKSAPPAGYFVIGDGPVIGTKQ